MKLGKTSLLTKLLMILAICISVCCFGLESQAATVVSRGIIPCEDADDAITWELDDQGVLTISGSGTMKSGTSWTAVWSGLDKSKVISVQMTTGSDIRLQTGYSAFEKFRNCQKMDLNGFDTSQVTNMGSMFYGCEALTELDVSGFDTSQVTYMEKMFRDCNALTELDVSGFDTSQVTDMGSMFYGCGALTGLDVSGFNTSQVTDMGSMFSDCKALTGLDVSGFDTSQVTNMGSIFCRCNALRSLDVSKWNTAKVTDMSSMFNGCRTFTNIDVSGLDTENVTDLANMFTDCRALTELDVSNFNTEKVENMVGMFWDCESLTAINVKGFNTTNVTNMSAMFKGCGLLEELDVTGFDTSKVTEMAEMFRECSTLAGLDIDHFNTANVTDMFGVFEGCSNLTKLDVSNFNTANVTDMSWMFANCDALEKIDLFQFSTGNVRDMSYMFCACDALTELDVSKFNTSNVTNLHSMFARCGLVNLDLTNFDTSNVTDMGSMFEGDTALKKLNLSGFDMKKVTDVTSFFEGVGGLETLVTPKATTILELPASTGKLWIDDAKNIYDTNPVTFTKATTLYCVKEKYNIHYEADGNTVDCPAQYSVKDGLTVSGSVQNPYAAFENWYFDAEYTQPATTIEPGTFGDITLYAKMLPNTYRITYENIEGASGTENMLSEYTYGSEYELPSLTKTCYALKGWFLDEDCTQKLPRITKTTGGDLILYAKWEESHDASVVKGLVEATCTTEGYTGDKHCKDCDTLVEKGTAIPMPEHDIDKEHGMVVKAATETETGTMEYKCKNCTYTITGEIPRLKAEDEVLNSKNDDDVKGSTFALLQAKADKTTKKYIRLKWTKVKDADGYLIYGNKCGKKNRYELIKTIKNGKKTSYTRKNLKKGTYYKFIVRAYKEVDGEKVSIAVSKTVHATTTGGKYGNAKSVKVKTDKKLKQNKKTKQYTLTIKKNKKYTIKASEVKSSKKSKTHRKIAFESGNPKIASVTKKGVVKGKKKGTCYVYAYAQNGVFQKIKVKVQ